MRELAGVRSATRRRSVGAARVGAIAMASQGRERRTQGHPGRRRRRCGYLPMPAVAGGRWKRAKVIVMGAGGRDFHDFNVVFREDAETRVVAFTAAQIPGIDDRRYPASLAGPLYPDGIPIVPEERLAELIHEGVDEVVFAYSDLAHADVMHKASLALAAGADFRLLGPRATMLLATKPVVAVTAVRTGCGKSQTTRRVGRILLDAGLRVALVRHPMPYGDLEAMPVQCFATLGGAGRGASDNRGARGVRATRTARHDRVCGRRLRGDPRARRGGGGRHHLGRRQQRLLVLRARPDDLVVDPLRAGHELAYHPGETNLRMADVVVVNKIDSAQIGAIEQVLKDVRSVNPDADIVFARSPVTLEPGPEIEGMRVLVVEDGPTLTHGGMVFGAGTVAAQSGRCGRARRPASVRGRLDRRRLRALSGCRRPTGDGLLRRTAARAGADDRRVRLRRRRHRDTDRPLAPHPLASSDPPCELRPRGDRRRGARGRPRAGARRSGQAAARPHRLRGARPHRFAVLELFRRGDFTRTSADG